MPFSRHLPVLGQLIETNDWLSFLNEEASVLRRENKPPKQRTLRDIFALTKSKRTALSAIVLEKNSELHTSETETYKLQTNDQLNRPFPSSYLPFLQSESKGEVFLRKISFHSYVK